ncbi:hypothetical protein U4I95_02490 [Stenotrophomonas maltophilia]|uniref:hypothetical protein n=1 Tax=Stenotrophomonas maltophilia TaxID=40324 RepID=UPI0013DBF726|nr:hypothetical protein [Stenotrophomonas maltophilia]MDZ5789346.1 hypothetical protein [Stenotrophomonas maltophilia]
MSDRKEPGRQTPRGKFQKFVYGQRDVFIALVGPVTMAVVGVGIGTILSKSIFDISRSGIGVLDWMRASSPAELTALFASIGAAAAAFITLFFQYLGRADMRNRSLRGFEYSGANYTDLLHAFRLARSANSHWSDAVNGPDQAEEAGPAFTPELIRELSDLVASEITARSTGADALNAIRLQNTANQERLHAEIRALNQRSKLNLAIGSMVTLFAALVLMYVAISEPPGDLTFLGMASHYVPRLSIVIFLEVFAFFFLRLYRGALADIRLYQVDLTRVSTQATAVELVFWSSTGSERAAIASSLINTEWTTSPTAPDRNAPAIDPKLIGELANIAAKMASKTS